MVEQRLGRRIGKRQASSSQVGCRVLSRGRDLLLETVVGETFGPKERTKSGQRIPQAPCLLLVMGPIAGGVVRRGVRSHPVGDRFDQRRTLSVGGAGEGDRVAAMTARTSLPSTCDAGDAVSWPRWAMVACDCRRTGSEIAHWLFWHTKTTGTV